MHSRKGMPSAPARRRTARRPLTWTCGSPGPPMWSSSPSRSGPDWVLMDIHHIMNGTRTLADVIFDQREERHSPLPTMEHPSQWQYVATRLMAHMGPIPQTT